MHTKHFPIDSTSFCCTSTSLRVVGPTGTHKPPSTHPPTHPRKHLPPLPTLSHCCALRCGTALCPPPSPRLCTRGPDRTESVVRCELQWASIACVDSIPWLRVHGVETMHMSEPDKICTCDSSSSLPPSKPSFHPSCSSFPSHPTQIRWLGPPPPPHPPKSSFCFSPTTLRA